MRMVKRLVTLHRELKKAKPTKKDKEDMLLFAEIRRQDAWDKYLRYIQGKKK